MTNGVEITLDKPRGIRFTFDELKPPRARLGKPMGEVVADLTRLSATTLQHALYAGLRSEDKRLRFEDVERLVTEYVESGRGALNDVLYLLNEAFTESGYFGRAAGDKAAAEERWGSGD